MNDQNDDVAGSNDALPAAKAAEPAAPPATPAAPPDPNIELSDAIRHQVADALRMLEFVVETGFRKDDSSTVDSATLTAIKTTAAMLGVSSVDYEDGKGRTGERNEFKSSEWVAFESAYYKLAQMLCPITAETLRNTQAVGSWRLGKMSPAQSFTRWLWVVAICYAAFVVGSEWGMTFHGPVLEGDAGLQNMWMQLVEILVPYGYGGLGACVYLLRSAHQYIYERSFDVRRKPEYLNRVLLGTISGGAIILFIEHVTTDDGAGVTLSSAALGFLAGYSTDFLFSTIERIIAAVLPKVGIDSVRKANAKPQASPPLDVAGTGLTELMDRLEKAKTDDEKKLYISLLEKVRERL